MPALAVRPGNGCTYEQPSDLLEFTADGKVVCEICQKTEKLRMMTRHLNAHKNSNKQHQERAGSAVPNHIFSGRRIYASCDSAILSEFSSRVNDAMALRVKTQKAACRSKGKARLQAAISTRDQTSTGAPDHLKIVHSLMTELPAPLTLLPANVLLGAAWSNQLSRAEIHTWASIPMAGEKLQHMLNAVRLDMSQIMTDLSGKSNQSRGKRYLAILQERNITGHVLPVEQSNCLRYLLSDASLEAARVELDSWVQSCHAFGIKCFELGMLVLDAQPTMRDDAQALFVKVSDLLKMDCTSVKLRWPLLHDLMASMHTHISL